jgi:hypothetical protein
MARTFTSVNPASLVVLDDDPVEEDDKADEGIAQHVVPVVLSILDQIKD